MKGEARIIKKEKSLLPPSPSPAPRRRKKEEPEYKNGLPSISVAEREEGKEGPKGRGREREKNLAPLNLRSATMPEERKKKKIEEGEKKGSLQPLAKGIKRKKRRLHLAGHGGKRKKDGEEEEKGKSACSPRLRRH